MAGRAPPPEPAPQTSSRWPRGWLRFDRYQDVHFRYMQVLARESYVESDSLSFTVFTDSRGKPEQVLLEGVIVCADGVAVEVEKFMDTRMQNGHLEVITTYYRYHAWRPGAGGAHVLRYDQSHGRLHRHKYDHLGHQVQHSDLDLDAMPRLDEVIREAVETVRLWS